MTAMDGLLHGESDDENFMYSLPNLGSRDLNEGFHTKIHTFGIGHNSERKATSFIVVEGQNVPCIHLYSSSFSRSIARLCRQ